MKRSEVVNDIALTLRGYDDDLVSNKDFLRLADIIVQVIEGLGMQPPRYYDSNDESYGEGWEDEDG